MASTGIILQKIPSFSLHFSPKCCERHMFAYNPSQFLSSKSLLGLKKKTLDSNRKIRGFNSPKVQALPTIFAAQSGFLKVIQTVWKVGKDGIEAGTNLVPDSVPRPIARTAVTVVTLTVALFVLKSFLSTVFFALAVMGLIYFTFIALNKDEGPKGGNGDLSSDEDSLEEARRIMEKYK